jgi:aldose 1-epimerase
VGRELSVELSCRWPIAQDAEESGDKSPHSKGISIVSGLEGAKEEPLAKALRREEREPLMIRLRYATVAFLLLGVITAAGVAMGVGEPPAHAAPHKARVEKSTIGQMPDGTEVDQYTLTNVHGLEVKVLTLGAMITTVKVPGREGKLESVTLYKDPPEEYLKRPTVMGAIVGRYANRIAGAKFTLNGVEYELSANAGKNHIHGGKRGFHTIVWDARPIEDEKAVGVELTHTSPDGHEGYPGTLEVKVVYQLTNLDELRMEYTARTDRPTHVNLTNHAYWNLGGADSGEVLNHVLMLNAGRYLPFGEGKIPLGELRSVEGTCMDFTKPKTIGSRVDQVEGKAYDHCYVLNKEPGRRLSLCARVVEPESGRVMEVYTTQPGVQLYTGNRRGPCLETQHFPGSPNQPVFPSTVLRPGQTYHEVTVHKFAIETTASVSGLGARVIIQAEDEEGLGIRIP